VVNFSKEAQYVKPEKVFEKVFVHQILLFNGLGNDNFW
jgi:hypothetical protein